VAKVAFEYRLYGMELSDLIQEGNIGLLKAVRKFDPRRGVRLISYAVWWIRAQIQSYIMANWSLVKIGTNQIEKKLFYKIGKIRDASKETNSDEEPVGLQTLARELKVSEKVIQEFEQRME
jgi:RNA polymerase sigma-32 factor